MRLIDLDALIQFPIRIDHYDKENGNENFIFGIETVIEFAENLPVIEAEPVKHGRWVEDGDFLICLNCESEINIKNSLGVENRKNYCPNCGCKMDLEGI